MTSIALDCGEIPWLHSSSDLAAVINNGYVVWWDLVRTGGEV